MPEVMVVDYDMGNLFSVEHACQQAGIDPTVTSDPDLVREADGVILPGVGAFGQAMQALRDRGLTDALRDLASTDVPFMGICLGAQVLMEEGSEFGHHEGLGLFEGDVRELESPDSAEDIKVPHIGWRRLQRTGRERTVEGVDLLESIPEEEYVYFVHSYHLHPTETVAFAETSYGPVTFPSAVIDGNVAGLQFHPERSGPPGLRIYENFGRAVANYKDK